ncbi:glycosyltransferase family 39 protein [Actinoplanes sp. NBRC 103695]|uniref:glycosyltransferase family 39 protein n=1 Tax=Actinoplanes sp. NBRC 103695 TaxID=3032202 RepID=UPI0024A022F6|nr:glycosyltransferase family 39 protein [Actinoplanes sp. NBRC 103695]GLY99408.1 glycosyl transferase [Actinoplanes sp. NBRC 103695]
MILRRAVVAAGMVLLFAWMAVAMVTAAREQTASSDEPVYVGAAAVIVERHSLAYNHEHPPLAKLVMGAGLAFADVRLPEPLPRSQWALGDAVLYQNGNDADRILFLARLPMIVLTMLFGLVVFLFARDLAGTWAGLAGLALYAFTPDVLAHGSLAGLDLPVAGFLLTAVWLLWRARRRPWLYLPLAGVALGAAIATRMTALAALPLIALWWIGRSLDRRSVLRGLAGAAGVVVIAIAVVWVCYLAVDPHLRWTPRAYSGERGQLIQFLPFPRPFRDGMRYQLGLEGKEYGAFLLGDYYVGHKWYYLPVALLIKEPLGLLFLGLAATLRKRAWIVLAPALLLLAVAMTGGRDWGVRYAIAVPVFLAVAAACVFIPREAPRRRLRLVVPVLALLFVIVSTVRAFPYYLPYSNEAFGGPVKTHLRLSDSNADWGQDLGRLAEELRRDHPGEQVWLAYRGSGDPAYYGITARDPLKVPASEVHGLLAVSSRSIPGARQPLRDLIATSTPIGEVGHSILLYRR